MFLKIAHFNCGLWMLLLFFYAVLESQGELAYGFTVRNRFDRFLSVDRLDVASHRHLGSHSEESVNHDVASPFKFFLYAIEDRVYDFS